VEPKFYLKKITVVEGTSRTLNIPHIIQLIGNISGA
jgi:hypothetical protein